MPNVLLYVMPERESEIKQLMPLLGIRLRKATAEALGDIEPDEVAVMALPIIAGDNATPMQIFAVGSESLERRKLLAKWRLSLAKAWRDFSKVYNITWGARVDVWPTFVPGMWGMTDDESIAKMEKADKAPASKSPIAHISMWTASIETALIIFDSLGWKEVPKRSNWGIGKETAVSCPGSHLEIYLTEDSRNVQVESGWANHVAFYCDVDARLAEIRKECDMLDLTMHIDHMVDGSAIVFIEELFLGMAMELIPDPKLTIDDLMQKK